MRAARPLAALLSVLWLGSCAVEPQAIRVGEDECSHCRMRISDPHFAAQLLTVQGRSYKFDSIECLAAFEIEENVPAERVHSLLVQDLDDPERWLPAKEAHFLRSEQLRSPMGLHLSAYGSAEAAAARRDELGGELLAWEEVEALVREAWQVSGPSAHP
jgi:copper chaperone NosL